MGVRSLVWRLASPYDAYISHVSQLSSAIDRIRYLSEKTLAYEAGLHGSMRLVPGERSAEERAKQFREQLAAAAKEMSESDFEEFITHLGSGHLAAVESDRAQLVARMGTTRRGLEEYFAIAGQQIETLAERGYNPRRGDVRRQLEENGLPTSTVADYRHLLGELGSRVGQKVA
jgi:hypothetical protein